MHLLEQIAQEIVEKTNEILEYPISITDNQGIIIGCTDKSRIGIFSQAALDVLKNNDMVECNYEIPKKVLPGVSAPIKFNHQIIGVLGIVGHPKEVEKYVQLVKNQVEMMCQEAFRNEIIELKEKTKEMFIHQLIHYNEKDTNGLELIQQYAKLLELDLKNEKVCLVIKINRLPLEDFKTENGEYIGTLQYFQKELINFLHLIFHEHKDDMIALLDFERYIVIKSLPFKESYDSLLIRLEEKLSKLNSFVQMKYHASITISIGNHYQGIKGMAESYQNAIQAMDHGVRMDNDCQIHIYKERETLLWLLPKELKESYQQKLMYSISSLIEHDSFDMLATTFKEFCKCNMNLSEAARKLFIHRNTIIYRLEKIREIVGIHTNSFEDCMLLYTAIQCFEDRKRGMDSIESR